MNDQKPHYNYWGLPSHYVWRIMWSTIVHHVIHCCIWPLPCGMWSTTVHHVIHYCESCDPLLCIMWSITVHYVIYYCRFGPVDDGGLTKRAKLSDEVNYHHCHHDDEHCFRTWISSRQEQLVLAVVWHQHWHLLKMMPRRKNERRNLAPYRWHPWAWRYGHTKSQMGKQFCFFHVGKKTDAGSQV